MPDKRDFYKTCRVRSNSRVLPERQGQYATIRSRVEDCYTLVFTDGEIAGLVYKDDLEEFCL